MGGLGRPLQATFRAGSERVVDLTIKFPILEVYMRKGILEGNCPSLKREEVASSLLTVRGPFRFAHLKSNIVV